MLTNHARFELNEYIRDADEGPGSQLKSVKLEIGFTFDNTKSIQSEL